MAVLHNIHALCYWTLQNEITQCDIFHFSFPGYRTDTQSMFSTVSKWFASDFHLFIFFFRWTSWLSFWLVMEGQGLRGLFWKHSNGLPGSQSFLQFEGILSYRYLFSGEFSKQMLSEEAMGTLTLPPQSSLEGRWLCSQACRSYRTRKEQTKELCCCLKVPSSLGV